VYSRALAQGAARSSDLDIAEEFVADGFNGVFTVEPV
jgi:hypothetical protein